MNSFQKELNEIKSSNNSPHPDRASKKTVSRLIDVTYRMAGYIDILEGEVDDLKARLRQAGGGE